MNLPLPCYYIIEPTNICNYRCAICPNALRENQAALGMMSLDLFHNILNQISESAKVIQLYWMGEPLLHENIFYMIRECKQRTRAKIMLSTNGSLLSSEISTKLVESGLDELIVSVDACESQDIYGKIRVGGDIRDLNSNIESLLLNKGNMSVVLQFIDMYVNRSEKERFLNKWKDSDCKTEISCLYTWASQIPSLNLASDNLSPVLKKKRVPCADLWNKMAIHWNGGVSACCFDFADKLLLGNCTNTSLEEIWNGLYINELRKQHMQEKHLSEPCTFCDAWAEPEEYEDLYHLEP